MLLEFTDRGIYCAQGDFYIDPWRPVERALITHAHSDHSRWGMERYLAHRDSVPIMRLRLGRDINIEGVEYGEERNINGVTVSYHPAGHIIGSSQIRVAYKGEVWVASGDYKTEDDGVSGAFEPIKCNAFISETTFGLPVYHWKPQAEIMDEINQWWAANAAEGRATLLIAYSLGKAQRVLQHLDASIGPIYCHGSTQNVNDAFREHGIELQPTRYVDPSLKKDAFRNAMILAPGSAIGSSWSRRFGNFSLGIASGWMQLRGARRRRAADRGFVLSDHADWRGLNDAIRATGAERIVLTHGYTHIFARWLNEQGYEAYVEQTLYEGEGELSEEGVEN